GKEKDNFPAGLGENMQMMQVGSTGGPSTQNSIYTRDFYLYTQAESDAPIVGHPIKLARSNEILQQSYKSSYMCYAHGVWGSRADPYRAIKGQCHGSSMTFPAGPNLDYEYGTFTFPTVYSPWDGSKQDHCIIDGKRHEGCTEVSVASEMHYMTQKIRVPINKNISIYAESGTLYRRMQPDNLRYECKVNVYLKNILPSEDCLTKSYLHGGWSAPYFAVGYIYKDAAGKSYDARYIYIPEKENSDRLAWRDASDTEIYAVSAGQEMPSKSVRENMRKYLNETLKVLSRHPVLYQVLGKRFFIATLKKNHLYEETGE
ncbi:MAG: hypothetical protein ACREHG_05480, partial [Candidatus Saccharimonadales bacterium]